MLAGLLLVVGAGVGVALWSSAQSQRSPVLVAASNVEAGEIIEVSDLRSTLVAVDGGVRTVPEAAGPGLVGATALVPISAGSLVVPEMFGDDSQLVPAGMALVGATLEPGRHPSGGLRATDQVILVNTTNDGPVRLGEAEVYAVTTLTDSISGGLFVSLLVPRGPLVDQVVGAAAADDLSLATLGSGS